MADTKISALPSASALTGTEQIPATQETSPVKLTVDQISSKVQGDLAIQEGLVPSASALTGTEQIPATQNGTNPVKLTVDQISSKVQGDISVQTFTAVALTNPYTASKSPHRIGDIALNLTSLEIWQANSETSALTSWNRISGGYYGGSVITDLNSPVASGYYTALGTALNVPDSAYSWFINHINSNTGNISAYQRAVAYSTTIIIYERTKIGSVWGAWSKIESFTTAYKNQVDQISANGVTELNIDKLYPLSTGYYTLSTAISAVSSQLRSVNAKITFKSAANTVETWQFKSTLDLFDNVNYWEKTIPSISILKAINIAIGINNYYIGLNGDHQYDVNYKSSDIFPVIPSAKIEYYGYCHNLVSGLAFYDSAKTFISGTNFGISGDTFVDSIITIPSTAYYCIASYNVNYDFSVIYENQLVSKLSDANSITTLKLKNGSGIDGVSIYRNIGSRAIWNTANKFATITLTDTITSLSLLRIMIYSYEKNFVSDIFLGLYITSSGISKIVVQNNATSHISSIQYIANTKQILITFADTNNHRVISVNECVSTNAAGNIKNISLDFSATIPIGTWVDVNNVSPLLDLEALITDLQNQINILQTGVFIQSTDYWNQATINGWIGTSGTDVGTDTNWRRSDYISCTPGDKIKFRLYEYTTVNSVSLYNSTKTYLSGYSVPVNGLYENEITIPDGVSYFRISGASDTSPGGSTTLPNYVNLISTTNIFGLLDNLSTQINNVEGGNITHIKDYWEQATITAYITKTGSLSGSDVNWRSTDYIFCTPGDILDVKLTGHNLVNNVSFYDVDHIYISGVGLTELGLFNQNVNVPENAIYMRISGASDTSPGGSTTLPHYVKKQETLNIFTELDNINSLVGDQSNIPVIIPFSIYTICNDIITAAKGRNRNYSQAIYIDHLFDGLTEEKNIRIKNGIDRVIFKSPITVTDSDETNPSVTYNGGVNILEETKNINLYGNDIVEKNLSVKHRSTLNSITATSHPRILCIGDSITYGEQALSYIDNYTKNHVYHLMCNELFMKDKIDNSNTDYDINFLGIYKRTNTFDYNGLTYNNVTHHEGIRGISLAQHLTGSVPQFWDDATSKWSINAWLSKYRTMDDGCNRLALGSGTGTLINSENINDIDVCTPTHVLIMLGTNNGGTLEQYQEMVNTIKSEIPTAIIGLAIPDSGGTYFPSLHPKNGELCTFWNDSINRHSQNYLLQKMLNNEYGNSTSEDNNIYLLPFFYITPPAESVSNRICNLPEAEFMDGRMFENYGWGAMIHLNAIGHSNLGYCLYSWIKYTIAKSI